MCFSSKPIEMLFIAQNHELKKNTKQQQRGKRNDKRTRKLRKISLFSHFIFIQPSKKNKHKNVKKNK